MNRALLVVTILAVGVLFVDAAPQEQIPLTFTQDGKDLVITATVRATRGTFVVQTRYNQLSQQKTVLYYNLIYNADTMRQSVAPVTITWRLANDSKGPGEYIVEKEAVIALTKDELRKLTTEK